MAQLIKAVIDTQKNTYRSIGQVSTGDDLELELEVKMNGQPIEFINPECELLIKKSDNNRIRQTKDILYQDGKFKIKLDEQGVTYPGIVTCQLLTREDGRVSTCLFYFMVGTSLDREVLQSISKVEVLEELDEYVATAFANLDEYEKRIISADETIRKLNDDMNEAEKIRGASELERQETFKDLKENMNATISNLESSINLSNLNEKERSEVFNSLKSDLESIKQDLNTLNTNITLEEGKRVQAEINRVNKALEIIEKLESTNNSVATAEAERVTVFNDIKSELTSLKEALTTINNTANSNEEVRKENEVGRVAAEQQRQDNFNSMKLENDNFKKGINEQYEQINTKVISVEERVQAIEENGVGGGNANIDDTTISKISTWSSEKIEDFVHTNDDVVWSTVQGENLSIDYTKQGHLREVEIWGNTWQDDTDSKNLIHSFIGAYNLNISDGTIIPDSACQCTDYIEVELTTSYYVKGSKAVTICAYDSNKTFIEGKQHISYLNHPTDETINNFNLPANTKYIRSTIRDTTTKYQIVEGTVELPYEEYHKADLSNIQHLGELYVDEQGDPILDELGREQYKIEVESCNKNLFNGNNEYHLIAYKGANSDIRDYKLCSLKLENNKTYTISHTTIGGNGSNDMRLKVYCGDAPIIEIWNSQSSTNKSKKFTTLTNELNNEYWLMGYDFGAGAIETEIQIEEGSIFTSYIPHKSNKTTLLLPCQLMKVGDVADRLYWDSSKNKYVVEKKIGNEVFKTENYLFQIGAIQSSWNGFSCSFARPSSIKLQKPIFTKIITVDNSLLHGEGISKYDTTFAGFTTDNYIRFFVKNASKLTEAKNIINDLNIDFYYVTTTSQLIETTILEQVKIPTYIDKTHLFVTGGIDGSIKAKVPLDGGQAIQTLSAKNVALNEEVITLSLENEELKQMDNELVATSWDMDFRMCEVEWTLEDLGIGQEVATLSLENNIKNMKGSVSNMALTRFEQAKIMIVGGVYNKETLTRQLTTYLNRGYLTQEEYDELVALMEARELVTS